MNLRQSLLLSAALGVSLVGAYAQTQAHAQTPAPGSVSGSLSGSLTGSPERSPDLVSNPVTVPGVVPAPVTLPVPPPTPVTVPVPAPVTAPVPSPAPGAVSAPATKPGTAAAGLYVLSSHVGDLPKARGVKVLPGHGPARHIRSYDVADGTLTLVGRGEGFANAGAVTFTTGNAAVAADLRARMETALGAPDTRRGPAVWSAPTESSSPTKSTGLQTFSGVAQFIHAREGREDIFRVERRLSSSAKGFALSNAAFANDPMRDGPKRASTRSMTPPPPPPGPGTAFIDFGGPDTGAQNRSASPGRSTPVED